MNRESIDHLIEENGGKAASLLAQWYTGNRNLLLPFTLIDSASFLGWRHPALPLQGDHILRGSGVGDEKGLVDVLETKYADPANQESFNFTIEGIIEQSKNKEVMDYAKWEGSNKYRGVSKIIIQPHNPGFRGSIVEHPNLQDHYIINIVTEDPFGVDGPVYQALTDLNGGVVRETSDLRGYLGVDINLIKQIVQMKQQTRSVGFVPESHSSQVEFGISYNAKRFKKLDYEFKTEPSAKILFYQERQFLPFDFWNDVNPKNYRFNRFGEAPKDTNLRVVVVNGFFADELGRWKPEEGDSSQEPYLAKLMNDGIPSVYVFGGSALSTQMPLSFKPNNMIGFMTSKNDPGSCSNALEHNTYRWILKSKFSELKDVVNSRLDGGMYTGQILTAR